MSNINGKFTPCQKLKHLLDIQNIPQFSSVYVLIFLVISDNGVAIPGLSLHLCILHQITKGWLCIRLCNLFRGPLVSRCIGWNKISNCLFFRGQRGLVERPRSKWIAFLIICLSNHSKTLWLWINDLTEERNVSIVFCGFPTCISLFMCSIPDVSCIPNFLTFHCIWLT